MQVFSIHLRPSALTPDNEAVLVKEGFCWPAFFFGPLWALSHRMWFATIGLLAVLISLGVVEVALRIDPLTYSSLMLGVASIIGFCGNDWRRNALDNRGWKMVGLSAAPDFDMALRRFIDLHPDPLDLRSGTATGRSSRPPGYGPVT